MPNVTISHALFPPLPKPPLEMSLVPSGWSPRASAFGGGASGAFAPMAPLIPPTSGLPALLLNLRAASQCQRASFECSMPGGPSQWHSSPTSQGGRTLLSPWDTLGLHSPCSWGPAMSAGYSQGLTFGHAGTETKEEKGLETEECDSHCSLEMQETLLTFRGPLLGLSQACWRPLQKPEGLGRGCLRAECCIEHWEWEETAPPPPSTCAAASLRPSDRHCSTRWPHSHWGRE